MRWPKTIIGSVDLWLLGLLLCVWACYDLMGTIEMLLYTDHMRYVW
jgi:hypothetical protein